jgi:hypothetical protein
MIGPPLEPARLPGALPGRPRSPRRGERGLSWVGLLLLLLVTGGSYLAWVWAPIYFESYTVKQTVQDYVNQARKNPDDEGLRHNMVLKIRSLYERDAVDEWGRVTRIPSIALEDRDVTWERDTRSQPPMLRVAFEYAREVEYPWLKRTATKVFSIDVTSDLTLADWGPQR